MSRVNSIIEGCQEALESQGFNAEEVEEGVDLCLDQLDHKLKTTGSRTRSAGDRLPLQGLCTEDIETCDPEAPFRTLTGQCNNLEHSAWGSGGIAMRRLLTPAYADKAKGTPRGGMTQMKDADVKNKDTPAKNCRTREAGRQLPSPRYYNYSANLFNYPIKAQSLQNVNHYIFMSANMYL